MFEKTVKRELNKQESLSQKKNKMYPSIDWQSLVNDDMVYQRKTSDVRYQLREKKSAPDQEPSVLQKKLMLIRQTGANCGMFAAAMALADLLGGDYKTQGEMIAGKLEMDMKEKGYSAIGEAFDANLLAEAINDFCNEIGEAGTGIRAEIKTFDSMEEMQTIFNEAEEGKAYVLFPYYANMDFSPVNPLYAGQATAGDMYRAHWSVIENIQEGNGENGRLHILEGCGKIFNGPDNSYLDLDNRLQQLFDSNMLLGEAMNWNVYFALDAGSKAEFACSRRYWNYLWTLGGNIHPTRYLDIVNLFEKVNLRGRAVLIKRGA